MDEPRKKTIHIGAPACFELELCCADLVNAFGHFGCFIVGSVLERADWRDVDIRYILPDEEFAKLFPGAGEHWEHNIRWLVMTISISGWLSKETGLPVDFQFQPQTQANEQHKGSRSAIGIAHKMSI